MKDMKFCKDCANRIDEKPLPRCGSSRFPDPVTGDNRRLCLIERLDGIGRCSSMANNFSPIPPKPKKKPGPKAKDE